tara:strand:- start:210 stop:593 length:384 start_codon:yes stop_codon:yes gene_type:complete
MSAHNILKNNTESLTFSEYHQVLQNNNLFFKNEYENKKLVEDKVNQKLFNLSLSQIGKNFANNFIKMLNDMVNLIDKYYNASDDEKNNKNSFVNEFFIIFIKDDRLVYSGIFFILLSFFFYFMDISS